MHVLSERASSGWAAVEATMAVAHDVATKTLLVCGYGIVVLFYLELYTESLFFSRYRSVFLGIYHTNTNGKPTENSVGTFRYQKGGNCPLSSLKGGNGPLLRSSAPLLRKKGGNDTKKGGTIPTEYTDTEPIGYRVNTDTETCEVDGV